MQKTWEKCLAADQQLEASIQYQTEEYAAIMCMDAYDHLIYPKRITNGMAYLYQTVDGKKPEYHHVKISEIKDSEKMDESDFILKKDRRHIHIAFRALLDQMDTLLTSSELSDKAKKVFAEEAENLLMTHGLLSDVADIMITEPAHFDDSHAHLN